ncbi:cellulase family glycosylhydrolase [Marinimicrobium locisalis]|uniref:cellulase family glycosylhydrolase n=1 Tax=Marinimicrobium locisalis TaxID=546022 RepID=UPI003221F932
MKSFLRHTASIALMSLSLWGLPNAHADISVSGTQVFDGNGHSFKMRGVNVPHAWFTGRTDQALQDIAALGANSVRVVLSNGAQWTRTSESEVASIISRAKAEGLITVLEVHDTTGYGESGDAGTISGAVDYWLDIQNVLQGEEDYVIINIANEPFGNGPSASTWVDAHTQAISRLRNAGLTHTLMVDAANWGQDWEGIMRNNARQVLNSDPQGDVIFSVHMYEVYDSDSAVNSYLSSFSSQGLALVVGEFAADHYGSYVAADAVMARAEQYGYGYLGWSWSGNSSELSSLDIANNFDGGSLTSWGEQLFYGANGIAHTAHPASTFGESAGSSSSSNSSENSGSTSCGTAANGYPYCCDSSSDTGGGWGWENEQSCVVPERTTNDTSGNDGADNTGDEDASSGGTCDWYGTAYPMCQNQTDGWGWENGQSCIGQITCNNQ